MSKKIDTRAVGLDIGLEAIKFLTGKENLHYGIWDGLDICAAHVGPAQEAYTDKLFELLPKGPLCILDIGGGAGETAKKLLALGQDTVYEMKFEEFETDKTYDLCLFSESFQYIPMEVSFPKVATLLKPNGHLIIADCFRTEAYYQPDRTSRVGGGHALTAYREALKTCAFHVLSEEDITTSVAPSVQVEQDLFHVIGLGVDRFDDELQSKRPMARKMIHGVLGMILSKRRRANLYDRLTGNTRTAEQFEKYNIYLMSALRLKS